MEPSHQELDLVLFGATGFTGGLTAEYLAVNGHPGMRWALAGRDRGRLEAVASRLAGINPDSAAPSVLVADALDPAALAAVAGATRVVLSAVGPYALYGGPLVAACAAAGTDYVDLSGEVEFVDRMYIEHHAEARATGARLVHCCGFESVPHDLGAWVTVRQLPAGIPLSVNGYVRTKAQPSGGTLHSVIGGFGRWRETLAAARRRRELEAPPGGRSVSAAPARIRYDKRSFDGWAAPLPTIDGAVIRRSAAADDRYGPHFTYGHNLTARHLATIVGMAVGVAAVAMLAVIPPVRRVLLKAKAPGDGPDPAVRSDSWFRIRFIGEGGGRRVVTEVSGGDPGHTETSKILAECGLCLAFDEIPRRAGQLTPVLAMGAENLLARLERAGMGFRIVESS